jgi:hypothetical protein
MKTDVYEIVTERLIAQLESGAASKAADFILGVERGEG